jgi:hypothetical protein
MRLWSDLYSAIHSFIIGIWKSFFNDKEGASARKLSAFAGLVIGYYITIYELPESQQFNALCIWLLYSLVCFGIIRAEQLIELKNGKNESKDEN